MKLITPPDNYLEQNNSCDMRFIICVDFNINILKYNTLIKKIIEVS